MQKTINIGELLEHVRANSGGWIILDVRSPSEFAEDRLPGAINLPVLSDSERADVGTIYKQVSTFEARQVGAGYIARNIGEILPRVQAMHDVSATTNYVVYCWRGGLRSRSLFVVMDMIGYRVRLLEGGYKAYRRHVNSFFAPANATGAARCRFLSIHGLTGTGKTEILGRLQSVGRPVLDLEAAAGHRGSVLGAIGDAQPSQKAFESVIYWSIGQESRRIFAEGESRRLGRRIIPAVLYGALIMSPRIWLELPRELRLARLAQEYSAASVLARLPFWQHSLGSRRAGLLRELLEKERTLEAADLLLGEYYDIAYEKAGPKYHPDRYAATIRAQSIDDAVIQIEDVYRALE